MYALIYQRLTRYTFSSECFFRRLVKNTTPIALKILTFQIAKDRIFNLQNDWLLFGGKSMNSTNDTSAIALDVFEMYLGKSYVLPDSAVFFFQNIGHGVWEIWSGFRASKSDTIGILKVGMTSKDRMEIDDLMRYRTNFRGVELRAITVVSAFLRLIFCSTRGYQELLRTSYLLADYRSR